MTVERMREIIKILEPYVIKSHTWDDIKDYMTVTLPVEESSEIIYNLEKYNKEEGWFRPRHDRFYKVHFTEGNKNYGPRINLIRDYHKSPQDNIYDHIKKDTYDKIKDYIKTSHHWTILKNYLRKTLTLEQATYIISRIELNKKGKYHKYSPSEKEGVYYYLFWNEKKNKYSVRYDDKNSSAKP